MKCNMDANQMLAYIKSKCFEGVEIDRVSAMSPEERCAFTMEQLERLLSEAWGQGAMRLSDCFWTTDECYVPICEDHPWLDDEGWPLAPKRLEEAGMTREDSRVAEWIMQLAMVSHDVVNHYVFDLDMLAPGLVMDEADLEADFTFDNRALIDFIRAHQDEQVGIWLAVIVYQQEVERVRGVNEPAQDELAQHWNVWKDGEYGRISGREWVESVFALIGSIRAHIDEGHALGLDDKVIGVHDALYGFVPKGYEANYVVAAREVRALMEASTTDYSAAVYDTQDDDFDAFCTRVDEIADAHELAPFREITYGYLGDLLGFSPWRERVDDDALRYDNDDDN